MIHVYATLLLTIGALVTISLYLWGEYTNRDSRARPYFLPATLLLTLLIAFITPAPVSIFYKAALSLGLILALLANFLRLLPGTPLVVEKAHLLIALTLYMIAFATLHPLKWPTPWLLLLLVGAGGIAWLLASRLAELQISLAIYGVILLLMLWQALEVLVVAGQLWSWVLFGGALLLVMAETLQGFDRFYQPLRFSKFVVTGFVLLGQLLLALSIWGSNFSNLFRLI